MNIRNAVAKKTAIFTSGSALAYTANDSVGVAQTLASVFPEDAPSGGRITTIDSVVIRDSAGQAAAGRLFFFSASPPTLTDNAAFAWGASLPNCIGSIQIVAGDYVAVDGKSVAVKHLLANQISFADGSTDLFVAFMTTGTPTYGAGGTLAVDIYFRN